MTRLAGGKAGVDGFVRGADLDASLGEPFGNRCDMMYLNTSLKAGPHFRTIIAHEYAHAVIFSRKALAGGKVGPEEEGWLDEGLAHLFEDSLGFSRSNIDYRVSAFLSRPERYRLVVDDYYSADLFRSHGNRGATYLFLRWCVDRYGPALLDSLIRSERRGFDNLEAATGSTFPQLFRRWTVALYLSGLDPSLLPEEGYRSIDPRGEFEDWILAGPRTSTLTPGEPGEAWSAEPTTAHYALIEGVALGRGDGRGDGPARGPVAGHRGPRYPGVRRDRSFESSPRRGPTARSGSGPRSSSETAPRYASGPSPGSPWSPPKIPGPRFPVGAASTCSGSLRPSGPRLSPRGGGLRSRPIRVPGVQVGDGPLVFKAVGTDAGGRRVAAWSDVSPRSKADALAIGDFQTP